MKPEMFYWFSETFLMAMQSLFYEIIFIISVEYSEHKKNISCGKLGFSEMMMFLINYNF